MWLICLRALSNMNNIKVSFRNIDGDIARFEYEFQDKIKEITKNNIINRNNNIDWLLLISPNNINFIENKECEKLYKLFNYLLDMFTNFDNENKNEIFETIKIFIFDVFENIYKNGIKNFLIEELKTENKKLNEINIITLSNRLENIIDNINKKILFEFVNNHKMFILKTIFENVIKTKGKESFKLIKKQLEQGLRLYEKFYNRKLVEKEIDSVYKNMELT